MFHELSYVALRFHQPLVQQQCRRCTVFIAIDMIHGVVRLTAQDSAEMFGDSIHTVREYKTLYVYPVA
jgi:hypothetical protein